MSPASACSYLWQKGALRQTRFNRLTMHILNTHWGEESKSLCSIPSNPTLPQKSKEDRKGERSASGLHYVCTYVWTSPLCYGVGVGRSM